jgi:1-acyl-sn-glycerol-3-phosphate acyltransferase
MMVFHQASGVAKASLKKNPLVGPMAAAAECIFVDRESNKGGRTVMD